MPQPGKDYQVPNTILVFDGDLTSGKGLFGSGALATHAFGVDRSLRNKGEGHIDAYLAEKKTEGFKVEEYTQLTRTQILNRLSNNSVYGFAIFAHGLYVGNPFLWMDSAPWTERPLGTAMVNRYGDDHLISAWDLNQIDYRFGEIVLWVCGACSDPEWINHVSTDGTLRGSESKIIASTGVSELPIVRR